MDIMILGLVIMMVSGTSGLDSDEPVCTSRFDYDHKMLQKLLLLEIDQTRLREHLKELTNDNVILKAALEDEITQKKALEVKYRDLAEVVSLQDTGANFIRWGRNSCPGNGTNMVYKGFAGGSHYTHTGAASNYLCLPEQPLWNVYEDATQPVWGAEYQFSFRNTNTFFGKPLHDRDIPCSVCHTKRAAVLMIPGRNECYDGWTLEYYGYLMAGPDGHAAASELVCLFGCRSRGVDRWNRRSRRKTIILRGGTLRIPSMSAVCEWQRADLRCLFQVNASHVNIETRV